MATTYKTLSANDIVTTKTLLHEAIPITGTIVSGTYKSGNNELSIKNYTHGMFQSVFDYPHLSSSANHIFDISVGFHATSSLSGSSAGHVQVSKKINMYNQMAQVLMGYDENGNIRRFDADGNLTDTTTDKMDEVIFINFARLLTKDEIKKGSFNLELGVNDAFATPFSERIKLSDTNAQNDFRVNSPAGEYAVLFADTTVQGPSNNDRLTQDNGTQKAGLLYYQAGIAVITASVFLSSGSNGMLIDAGGGDSKMDSANKTISKLLSGSAISASCDALRHRVYNLSFNNTTELNSTVYFCRAHHNEFNYSTNPTYLSSSQIVVKNNAADSPVSYITTVGLYSSDNELLATAKLSEPLKKDPSNELTLRVRLDY